MLMVTGKAITRVEAYIAAITKPICGALMVHVSSTDDVGALSAADALAFIVVPAGGPRRILNKNVIMEGRCGRG